MAITFGEHGLKSGRKREERFIHFLARECQWILRGLVILLVAATILLMFTLFYAAFITALLLLVTYCLLLVADYVEYRTHRPGDPGWESELPASERAATAAAEAEPITAEEAATEHVRDVVKERLTKTVIGIIASVALAAVIVAGIFLGLELLAIGGMILFAYWLFIAAPLWLGWLEDEAEETAHRAEEELEHHH